MKFRIVSITFILALTCAQALQAQIPNEVIKKIAVKTASMACRANKQMAAYEAGYADGIHCMTTNDNNVCLELSKGNKKTLSIDMNTCDKDIQESKR